MDIIYYTIAICFILTVKYIAELHYKKDTDYFSLHKPIKPVYHIFWYYVFTFLGCVLHVVFVYVLILFIDSFRFLSGTL